MKVFLNLVLFLVFINTASAYIDPGAGYRRFNFWLPQGTHEGNNGHDIDCSVTRLPFFSFDQIMISSEECEGLCAKFSGSVILGNGGGCLKFISNNPFDIHMTNEPMPWGAPNFCRPDYNTPGGVRLLRYGQKVKVEILDMDGSLKASCSLNRF